MKQQLRPPAAPPKGEAITVAPGQYPVFSSSVAMGLTRALRDPNVSTRAAEAIAESTAPMRKSVLELVARLDAASTAGDFVQIYEVSHEIRGLAGNAGLKTTALIANELCRYLDAFAQAGITPEQAVVRLHLESISRATRMEDETAALGDTVAAQLAQLVNKKLAEINA